MPKERVCVRLTAGIMLAKGLETRPERPACRRAGDVLNGQRALTGEVLDLCLCREGEATTRTLGLDSDNSGLFQELDAKSAAAESQAPVPRLIPPQCMWNALQKALITFPLSDNFFRRSSPLPADKGKRVRKGK